MFAHIIVHESLVDMDLCPILAKFSSAQSADKVVEAIVQYAIFFCVY